MPPDRLVVPALVLATVTALGGPARADRRAFTRTDEYATMAEDQTEIELYSTHSRATFAGDASPQRFELRLELEHGLTDRWDVSLDHVFAQASDGAGGGAPLALTEIKLRTRYRFAERSELPVDLLAQAEVGKEFGVGVYALAGKAIIARDLGRTTVATNLIAELVLGNDVDEPVVELGWAAGATFEVSPSWKVGAETWGGFEAEHTDVLAASAGPSVSWAPSQALWVTTTAGWGLTDHADAFSVRAILGLGL